MDLLQIISLAVMQGLTEFLPISSSAHLILSPYIFGFSDQGLLFDVAVHLGSLFAVMSYFRRDIVDIGIAWFGALPPQKNSTAESRLGWAIIIGTIPVVVFGLLLKDIVESDFREPWIIGTTTIVFGLLLAYADITAKRVRDTDNLSLANILFIGFAQVLALVPGTSRSGITMTAGLLLGLTRKAAARFSFLLSIPTILASSALVSFSLFNSTASIDWGALITGVALSALAAYICIHLFMRFIERIGMLPFVIYRLILGGVIFWIIS